MAQLERYEECAHKRAHHHGDYLTYRVHGCRCGPCRAAWSHKIKTSSYHRHRRGGTTLTVISEDCGAGSVFPSLIIQGTVCRTVNEPSGDGLMVTVHVYGVLLLLPPLFLSVIIDVWM